MRAMKTKAFARWADGEGLGDEALAKAKKAGELIEIEVDDNG
jgi:hypothetical protein